MLTSLDDLKKLKSRDFVKLECLRCGIVHYRTKNLVQRVLNGDLQNTKKGTYCSRKCVLLAQTKKVECICPQCNVLFVRELNQRKKVKLSFCTQSCSAKYNNAHKTHGTRRSKLEKYIELQLIMLFPNLEIHFNRKDTLNSELDIYIPSLKLAFELNGIFHYEPIFGSDKLSQIQNNDNRKFQACLEKQIELCIIDTSHMKYFKEKIANKYLNIVCSIINAKVADK